MARLESQADMMYVATPVLICERLREWLDIPGHVQVLDPCCGAGTAVRALVPKGKVYGIELEAKRAMAARQVLDRVLACSMQEARLSHNCFGLVFLNPPYADSTEGRLEVAFLERCLNYLRPGGVLVYIIKEDFYRTAKVLGPLSRQCEDFHHWRFPDPYFDGPDLAFHQTVLVCRKRAAPNLERVDLERFSLETLKVGKLEPCFPPYGETYRVPAGVSPPMFLPGNLGPEVMDELLRTSPVGRVVDVSQLEAERPPLPLRAGHLSLVLASGMVDGVYGAGAECHVAKGTVQRKEIKENKVEENDGGSTTVTKIKTDTFSITVRTLERCGTITDLADGVATEKKADSEFEIVEPTDGEEDDDAA